MFRDQKAPISKMLAEVFALSDEELGETDAVEHSIDTSTARPVKQPLRRLPYALRKQLKDTILDRYPLPREDELIDVIGSQKAMYFTTLDLMRGYHQVKMAEESKEKTAFVCHRGL